MAIVSFNWSFGWNFSCYFSTFNECSSFVFFVVWFYNFSLVFIYCWMETPVCHPSLKLHKVRRRTRIKMNRIVPHFMCRGAGRIGSIVYRVEFKTIIAVVSVCSCLVWHVILVQLFVRTSALLWMGCAQ